MQKIMTERLILSHFSVEDAAFIFELLNTPTWIQFIGDRNIHTLADAEAYILNKLMPAYANLGFGFYAVKLKENGQAIGMCGLIKRAGLEDVDIGFAFLPAFTGKGYAFEAADATMKYAKESLKIPKIVAITIQSNVHSIRLLEKIGLSFEKIIYLPHDTEALMLFS